MKGSTIETERGSATGKEIEIRRGKGKEGDTANMNMPWRMATNLLLFLAENALPLPPREQMRGALYDLLLLLFLLMMDGVYSY